MTKPSSARRLCGLACVVAVAAGLLAACGTGGDPAPVKTVYRTQSQQPAGQSTAAAPTTESSSVPAKPKKVVKVTSLESDNQTYGVGMPIVLYFSPPPTDSTAFTKAVKVTVDGQPANGAWYWEQPTKDEVDRHVVEAHYRPQHYWKADSQIHVDIPIAGLSAGTTKKYDLVYSGKLTSLDYAIGDAHISTVSAGAKTMTVTSNGKTVKQIEVSLGAAKTPTYNGVKVVMQKGEDDPATGKLKPNGTVQMRGPGYNEPVQWSVRITQSGEYVHAAPWNTHLGRLNTSNGCTNLSVADAKWFYKFSRLGDVVKYTGTEGTLMPSWDGLGDWNVPWPQWQRGGPAFPA